ncbi:MAG: PhzF family phenazine biosynthesis protein [Elusimicrobiota bacterium]
MGIPAFVVDAFAEKPFTGNPAAVVLLDAPRDDAWRQAVAAEFNLSETAFVETRGDSFILRWFTPAVEVELCGHATLAAAHALWEAGNTPPDRPIRFETKSGTLSARRDGERIVLDFPALPVSAAKPPTGLLAALTDAPTACAENAGNYLLEMASEEAVRRAAPDLAKWSALTKKGLLLTAPALEKTYDVVSRCFFPADGIPEDPVTGSAHCAIGPYWAEKLGKTELTAHQASRRGGILIVRVKGGRVELGGRAFTSWRGSLR